MNENKNLKIIALISHQEKENLQIIVGIRVIIL